MNKRNERIVILNFGGRHGQAIAREIRELGVYSELLSGRTSVEKLQERRPKGLVLVGEATNDSRWIASGDPMLFDLGVPVLVVSSGEDRTPEGPQRKHVNYLKWENADEGRQALARFVFDTCRCPKNWDMDVFIEETVNELRETIGKANVLCALSGGVDSAVTATLVHRAVGQQLTCMFVDHGLLRKGEVERVMDTFADQFSMNVVKVDAKARFLSKLSGVTDPEEKRKAIGNEFIQVFAEEAGKFGDHEFLAQGTVYTDVIESGAEEQSTIKSHHNVGGLPENVPFRLVEPLKYLFKDEVRRVGELLGLPEDIVWRQPFPGPGLAIRVIGEVTEERLAIVREADAILREEIRKAGLFREIWQYFTVLTDLRSVGVRNDARTYDYTVGIRAVTSVEGMTADWARIPYDVLAHISKRITDEVPGVNRVVYDVTSKPPATIEWE